MAALRERCSCRNQGKVLEKSMEIRPLEHSLASLDLILVDMETVEH